MRLPFRGTNCQDKTRAEDGQPPHRPRPWGHQILKDPRAERGGRDRQELHAPVCASLVRGESWYLPILGTRQHLAGSSRQFGTKRPPLEKCLGHRRATAREVPEGLLPAGKLCHLSIKEHGHLPGSGCGPSMIKTSSERLHETQLTALNPSLVRWLGPGISISNVPRRRGGPCPLAAL